MSHSDIEPLETYMRDILAAGSPLLINGVDPFADLDESQIDDIALIHKIRFPPPLVDVETRVGDENPSIHAGRCISPETK